jgi:transcriptional regulator with XRE-family HTH domain
MYDPTKTADKIKIVAKERNVSIRQVLLSSGLNYNTMSNMKNSMPKADNLARIADYLDCSVDYLLGRTDNPEINR